MFASACSFCPASCFLMQHRTVSPGLLGDLVMFFFFLPVLAGNENQLLCCCHRSGEVCFLSTFIPGTSPSTVTVETRATPTLFPSMSPSFNDLALLSFFLIRYLPTLEQPMEYLENCVTSLKRMCIKAEMKNCRSTCCCTARTAAPELLSNMPALQGNKAKGFVELHELPHPKRNNQLRRVFHQHVISPTPPNSSVNLGKQYVTCDMAFPKSFYCCLSAHKVTRNEVEGSK